MRAIREEDVLAALRELESTRVDLSRDRQGASQALAKLPSLTVGAQPRRYSLPMPEYARQLCHQAEHRRRE